MYVLASGVCELDEHPGLQDLCAVAAIDKFTRTTKILWGKKGWHGHSLSERAREGQREPLRKPDPRLDRLLLLFWTVYIEDGPHLLCPCSL